MVDKNYIFKEKEKFVKTNKTLPIYEVYIANDTHEERQQRIMLAEQKGENMNEYFSNKYSN